MSDPYSAHGPGWRRETRDWQNIREALIGGSRDFHQEHFDRLNPAPPGGYGAGPTNAIGGLVVGGLIAILGIVWGAAVLYQLVQEQFGSVPGFVLAVSAFVLAFFFPMTVIPVAALGIGALFILEGQGTISNVVAFGVIGATFLLLLPAFVLERRAARSRSYLVARRGWRVLVMAAIAFMISAFLIGNSLPWKSVGTGPLAAGVALIVTFVGLYWVKQAILRPMARGGSRILGSVYVAMLLACSVAAAAVWWHAVDRFSLLYGVSDKGRQAVVNCRSSRPDLIGVALCRDVEILFDVVSADYVYRNGTPPGWIRSREGVGAAIPASWQALKRDIETLSSRTSLARTNSEKLTFLSNYFDAVGRWHKDYLTYSKAKSPEKTVWYEHAPEYLLYLGPALAEIKARPRTR